MRGAVVPVQTAARLQLKLKQIHWTKLNNGPIDVSGTVWADSPRQMDEDTNRPESQRCVDESVIDIGELEKLFALEEDNKKVVSVKDGDSKKKKVVQLIDAGQAHKVAISLKGMRRRGDDGKEDEGPRLTLDEICTSLLTMDVDALTEKHLKGLKKDGIATDKDQRVLLKYVRDNSSEEERSSAGANPTTKYDALACFQDLGLAEKFFLKTLHIPRLRQRVSCMEFRAFFNDASGGPAKVESELNKVLIAAAQVKASRELGKALKAMLRVGNHLNGGSRRGNAQAFKLDTLKNIIDVRSTTDRKTSVLHFIISERMRKDGAGETLMLGKELDTVPAAADVSIASLTESLNEMENSLELVKSEILAASVGDDAEAHDNFGDRMSGFANDAEKRLLGLRAMMTQTMDALKDLYAWFGETYQEQHPMHFITLLPGFVASYEKAHGEVMARRAREKKMEEEEKKKEEAKSAGGGDDEAPRSSLARRATIAMPSGLPRTSDDPSGRARSFTVSSSTSAPPSSTSEWSHISKPDSNALLAGAARLRKVSADKGVPTSSSPTQDDDEASTESHPQQEKELEEEEEEEEEVKAATESTLSKADDVVTADHSTS